MGHAGGAMSKCVLASLKNMWFYSGDLNLFLEEEMKKVEEAGGKVIVVTQEKRTIVVLFSS